MSAAGVISVSATIEGFSNLFGQAIRAKLGKDRDTLKEFGVSMYEPDTPEAAEEQAALGKRLFNVSGFLALNDAGNGKYFHILMEEGLSVAEDAEVADQLAHQCLLCVAQMKRERSKPTLVSV